MILDDEDNPFNYNQNEDVGYLEEDQDNYEYDQKAPSNNENSPIESTD